MATNRKTKKRGPPEQRQACEYLDMRCGEAVRGDVRPTTYEQQSSYEVYRMLSRNGPSNPDASALSGDMSMEAVDESMEACDDPG